MNNKYFDFSDINLIPDFGIVSSRSVCDTSVKLGNHIFKLPVYPANMESVITPHIATKLANEGYFYTMHRFLTDEELISFMQHMKANNLLISISVGVGTKWQNFLYDLKDEHDIIPDFITIDIAHGHSMVMEAMVNYTKEVFPDTFLIAGNISTVEAANALATWGVNAVKVGIAPGLACTTAMATGFGSRGIQASTIQEISDNLEYDIKIIADGGIKHHGDIAKALVLGADMVMAGSMFAGFQESPGKIIDTVDVITDHYKMKLPTNNIKHVEYWGSASSFQSGKTNRIEGTKIKIPFKDRSILSEFNSIKESLQSAISYAGGDNLQAFLTTKYKIIK